MDVNALKNLEKQINLVIPLLEQQYQKTPTSMLELIITRYKKAVDIIAGTSIDEINKKQLQIVGSVRAYLDSASDYMNPMLEEMYKAEELLKKVFSKI